MNIRRRGVEMRLIVKGNGAPVPREDWALLKTNAWAHQWSDALLSGRARSVEEIADRETDRRLDAHEQRSYTRGT
jgi:hypothetical protein